VDESFHHPVAAGFPGVRPGAKEYPERRLRIAYADDFQFTPLNGLADGGDLHKPIRADAGQELVEVGQAVRLDARDVEPRAGHLEVQPNAVFWQALYRNRLPGATVLRDDDGLQLTGNRSTDAVPHVVEIPEFECQF
jgi:hypothetical protein